MLSGRISRRVEGASPTMRSASSQYSGWEVNWSQATTAHLLMSASRGSRMSAGFMPSLAYVSFMSFFLRRMLFDIRAGFSTRRIYFT